VRSVHHSKTFWEDAPSNSTRIASQRERAVLQCQNLANRDSSRSVRIFARAFASFRFHARISGVAGAVVISGTVMFMDRIPDGAGVVVGAVVLVGGSGGYGSAPDTMSQRPSPSRYVSTKNAHGG